MPTCTVCTFVETFHPVLLRNLCSLIVGYTLIHGCYTLLNVSHTVLGRSNRTMIGTPSFFCGFKRSVLRSLVVTRTL